MEKKRNYHHLIRRIENLRKKSPYIQVHIPGRLNYPDKEYPFFVVYISHDKKPFQQDKKNVCLSSGTHGDEPAGVEALLSILESPGFLIPHLASFDFMVFPCVNPGGFEYHQRGNLDGVDLNRQFRHAAPPQEVSFIKNLTHSIPFSLLLDFHEDVDSPGFYLYEVVQKGAVRCGEKIIDAVSSKYPINLQEKIEGMIARKGVIGRDEQSHSLDFDVILKTNSNWPMAFYFFSKGTPHALTFETPVHLDMRDRVEIHSTAFTTVLKSLK